MIANLLMEEKGSVLHSDGYLERFGEGSCDGCKKPKASIYLCSFSIIRLSLNRMFPALQVPCS
jgi:hypothetical protein